MADNDDVLRCPLCQGHGELRRTELDEWLADPELRGVIQRYLAKFYPAKARELSGPAQEPACVGANANGQQDFEKEVHRWNKELPIFRRSPKE